MKAELFNAQMVQRNSELHTQIRLLEMKAEEAIARAVRAEAERDASNARDIERTQALVNMRERAERAEAERDAARRDRDTAAEELRRTMAEYSSASLRDAVPAEPEVQAAPPACGAVDGDDTCDLPPGHRGAHSCVSVTRGRRSWQDD